MSTKVLVFESDAAFAGELRNELGRLGCSTCVVDDGSVGLQQASADKPDLILLSIELPRMNGFSVCNKLKKDPALKDVPLIIMSTESSDETFEQHRKLRTRAEDYVHKPIAFGELLQHIRTFVAMGEAPLDSFVEGDGIVIDDEIAIQSVDGYDDDDEGTQTAVRPELPRDGEVDAEVDAFTESAFGRLQGARPSEPTAQMPTKTNGARERAASVRPPPSVRASAPVPTSADQTELDRVHVDVERGHHRAEQLEKELAAVKESLAQAQEGADVEIERKAREIEELKARLQQSAKGSSAASSREFLDLREALNKKDKEILALKESSSKKDKDVFDARDKLLALERAQSDFEDRIIAKERAVAELQEKADELQSRVDEGKQKGEALQNQLGKAELDLAARVKELEESEARRAQENAEREAAVRTEKADHAKALQDADAAQRQALEELEKRRVQEHSQAEAERHRAIETLQTQHAQALSSAEAQRVKELEQERAEKERAISDARKAVDAQAAQAVGIREAALRAEFDDKVASLQRSHQDELNRTREDFRQQLESQTHAADDQLATALRDADERLTASKLEADAALAQAVSTLEARAATQLADLGAQAEAEKAAASERTTALERELAEVTRKHRDLVDEKNITDAENANRVAELNGRVSQLSAGQGELEKNFSHARDHAARLEIELSSLRTELQDMKTRLANESARVHKALSKWDSDRATLERAKDALAVALTQIDEVEGRSIG